MSRKLIVVRDQSGTYVGEVDEQNYLGSPNIKPGEMAELHKARRFISITGPGPEGMIQVNSMILPLDHLDGPLPTPLHVRLTCYYEVSEKMRPDFDRMIEACEQIEMQMSAMSAGIALPDSRKMPFPGQRR